MRRVFLLFTAFFLVATQAPAVELGEDGLHKPEWLHTTFKDMRDDLAEASSQGKRLLIMFEQRGCVYCTKMHEEVFPDPTIDALLKERYFVVQMNLFGDEEVTDFDGTTLPEKDMAVRWGVIFTPTLLFMPDKMPEGGKASDAAVVIMPGAFGKLTTKALLTWVLEKGYEGDEHFQKYLARKIAAEKG